MNKEYLNVILMDNDEENQMIFRHMLNNLKINIKIQSFPGGDDLMEFLNNEENLIPEILFMNYEISEKNNLQYIKEIRKNRRLGNMVIAMYYHHLTEDKIEEIFVTGANIYISRPDKYRAMKKILSEVIAVSWQYHTSGLNKDTFIMKV